MTDLDRLIEAVEAGTWDARAATSDGVLPESGMSGNDWVDHYGNAFQAFNGSLDAAKALHEALVPGWGWTSATDAHGEQWFCVWDQGGDFESDEIYSDNPARSWLLAILKAYRDTQREAT